MGNTAGPTTGAEELKIEHQRWSSNRPAAVAIRVVALLTPLVASFLFLRAVSGWLWRPEGLTGTVLWLCQAIVVGAVVSVSVERATRRLLPVATLFEMSLAFPDEAPGRFAVALKAGTVKKLARRELGEDADDLVAHIRRGGSLGTSTNEAAVNAITLVTAIGKHDRLTRGHTERVRAYADLIAKQMRMPEKDRHMLAWGALLHDVGKLTVSPEILNKDGRPTDEEWAILRNHPMAGVKILEPMAAWLGPSIGAAAEHHERWDGEGYPLGLKGEEISLAGRITAVADAYDVITSKRSYKEPLSAAAARKELVDCSGKQFDPAVVRAFMHASLGRRWAVGPLASFAELPLVSIGTSVVASPGSVAAGTVMAVTAIAAPAALESDTAEPETLALVSSESTTTAVFAAAPVSTVEGSETPTTVSVPLELTTIPPTSETTTSTDPVGTTPPIFAPAPTVTTTRPATTSTSAASTTAPPTTTASTTTTTAAPTTTTTEATTTTTSFWGGQNYTVLTEPPASFAAGAVESDSQMFVLNEGGPVVLANPLTAHLPPPELVVFLPRNLTTVTIPVGTSLCSVFVHYDPSTEQTTLATTISIPFPIVGLTNKISELEASHFFALPGMDAPYDRFAVTDSVRLVDANTVEFVGTEEEGIDQARIFYEC